MGAEAIEGLDQAPTKHARLVAWVKDIATLTKPDRVYWCDGSDAEWEALTTQLCESGTLTRLCGSTPCAENCLARRTASRQVETGSAV